MDYIFAENFYQKIKQQKNLIVYFYTKLDSETGNFLLELYELQKELKYSNQIYFDIVCYEGKPAPSILQFLDLKDFSFTFATFLFYDFGQNYERFNGNRRKRFVDVWFKRILRDREKIKSKRLPDLGRIQSLLKETKEGYAGRGMLVFCGDFESREFYFYDKEAPKNFNHYFFYSKSDSNCRRLNLRAKGEALDIFEYSMEKTIQMSVEERDKSIEELKIKLDPELITGRISLLNYLDRIKFFPSKKVVEVKNFDEKLYKRSELTGTTLFFIYPKQNPKLDSFRNYPKWFYFSLENGFDSVEKINAFVESCLREMRSIEKEKET